MPARRREETPRWKVAAGLLCLLSSLGCFLAAAGGKAAVGPAFDGAVLVVPGYALLLTGINVVLGPPAMRAVARALVLLLPAAGRVAETLARAGAEAAARLGDDTEEG